MGNKNPSFGKSPTKETREKISTKLGHAIEVTDTTENITRVYDTIGKAAFSLGASYTTLGRYIKSQKLYLGRYLVVKVISK
jgi:hypothetical protein